ncbi:MAG: S8 family serine peptidase [Acidobacteriaceae bacterium]|nr:S8 family serine peptidase [Acidobacteriaceae bacterium]
MSSHVTLCGSRLNHPRHSEPAGEAAPDEVIHVNLVVRRRNPVPDVALHQQLSRDRFALAHGADPADIQVVEDFASAHRLAIRRIHPASRVITLTGRLSELIAIFGASVEMRRMGANTFRSCQGELILPAELAERVVAVFGFDQRPLARTHHIHQRTSGVSYTPTEVAKLYHFPAATGKNQTIALIELGGGYRNSDLQAYWRQVGVGNVSVAAVSVDGGNNSPVGDPNSADGEVVLDIEVAGAVAPDARIAVYFAGNTDQGFLDAINAAIHDTVRRPSVISISWGAPEKEWTPQALNAFNAAFHDAALLGITVCAAAGDNGSSDGEEDGLNHADFPASSPWVLGCGGTRLISENGSIQSETVWNDGTNGGATGGGVSSHFAKPEYQAHINVPVSRETKRTGRGVPDVAAVADPETGYQILVDGQMGVVGGTSAVAPLWAGLIALFNEELDKHLGWLNPTLYGAISQHGALHDITSGTNGAYRAQSGWDACTGLGSPNGQAILDVLKQSAK